MTERESSDWRETRILIYNRAMGECEICGKAVGCDFQAAHQIPKTKANLKKYGKKVVHHPMNFMVTCSLRCNSDALAHGLEVDRLVAKIQEEIEKNGTAR